MKGLMVALLLVLGAGSAQAQTRTYTLQGCNALSCHQMVFFLSPDGTGRTDVRVTGTANFFQPGAFRDCGLGCAWSTPVNIFGPPDDIFHAGANGCLYLANTTGVTFENYCVGTSGWVSSFRTADNNWFPTSALVNLQFQGVGPSQLTLQLVPEPATFILLGAGLVGIAVLRRRRRA